MRWKDIELAPSFLLDGYFHVDVTFNVQQKGVV